jgi:hypothetical protein
MGLGLYVARRLMEEQGGQLAASNNAAGGARFSLKFPPGDEVVAEADTIVAEAEERTARGADLAQTPIRRLGGGSTQVRPQHLSSVGGER